VVAIIPERLIAWWRAARDLFPGFEVALEKRGHEVEAAHVETLDSSSGRQEPQGRGFERRTVRLVKVNTWALGAPYYYEARFLGAVALGLVDPL
jgi:hypothetical protein